MRVLPAVFVWLGLQSGCAVLHHVQIGDIDNREGSRSPIDIKVSEVGVNVDDAASIVGSLGGKKEARDANRLAEYIGYFQMGPRTGNAVYTSDYARKIVDKVWEACPAGTITALQSIRETRAYPVISGEIVKIKAECLTIK